MSFAGKHLCGTFSSVNATKKLADDEEARGACELWVQNLTRSCKKVLRSCFCCCCCCFKLSVLEHFAEDKKKEGEGVFGRVSE